MREVVLAGAVRTAIGAFGGTLAQTPARNLGAVVIREALRRSGIDGAQVDEVLFGCVLQAGLGQNVARQAARDAGIPDVVPALTLNNVCGSGLKTVNLAAAMIQAGQAEIVVAGGVENMSLAPYLMPSARFGYRMNHAKVLDSMIHDALWDAFGDYHMGVTAENLAKRYGITREMQDAFAADSQQKCERAQAENRFADEVVPVPVKVKRETVLFERDEYPRAGVTAESLAKLKPAFEDGGTVTAGNSSGINDGGAAVIVMSEEKARQLGVAPMARWVSGASFGVDPAVMGIGPVGATQKALEAANWTLDSVHRIEANEAFAVQALAVGKELGWDPARVNVNGGAIALGHPVGASGCRILVTLLHQLRRENLTRGLATLCVGGGMGVTAAVEAV